VDAVAPKSAVPILQHERDHQQAEFGMELTLTVYKYSFDLDYTQEGR
jgi:hypothetical protein